MDSTAITALTIVGSVASIIGLFALFIHMKKPKLSFYIGRAVMPVKVNGKQQKVEFMIGRIENKRGILGETAKMVECNKAQHFKVHSTDSMHATHLGPLPWFDSHYDDKPIEADSIRGDEDIIRIFEEHVWTRGKRSIPQGHAEMFAIAVRFMGSKKVYWASSPPEEVSQPAPPHTGTFHPFALEVSGENVPSTYSPNSMLMLLYEQWTVPAGRSLVMTPSKWRNLALRLGLWRDEEEFIPGIPDLQGAIPFRPLGIATKNRGKS